MVLEVIVDISNSEVDRTFDYEGDDVPVGSRVAVEFGKKQLIGFVTGKKESSEFKSLKRARYLDTPITPEQLALMDHMRSAYNLRYIDVLRLFVPVKLREEKAPQYTRIFLSLSDETGADDALAKIGARAVKQLDAMKYVIENDGAFQSELSDKFGAACVKALKDKGLLSESAVHVRSVPMKTLSREKKSVVLTSAQKNAVDRIEKGGRFLLHGVTGSGKTEVYETVIENALKKGKTAIMLVPEISLTPQMLGIFRARFGDNVALLHSGLNASERYDEWKRLYDGDAKIAIGARSAIFAPLRNLGVIIIDEEHDGSYLSESNPRYDTKNVAEYRAAFNDDCALVLGSATPDMESYLKATDGRYELITLSERISRHKLPEMEIVDMTNEFRMGNRSIFSIALKEALGDALKRGEQAMLFLNRRGFASFIRCKECGYVAKCEDCDVSLTYHKSENELKCHYCGRRYHALTKCPECGSTEIKQGRIGTEKVVDEIKAVFPDARVLRMDNDTTTRKDSYFAILDKFAKHEADILVGTQMIAKGHDFADVTLVGILEADAALYFSDYRSSERTFQLITQVAGRAGRADKKGRVILQTYAPRHYVFRYGKDYDYKGFWSKEINSRMVTKFPPFTKLVRVLVSSTDEQDAVDCARTVYKSMCALQEDYGKFVYIGASRSPVTRMNGMVRYQTIARIVPEEYDKVITKIYEISSQNKPKKGSCFVEVNPQSLI